jgi:hypothetical protein
MFQGIGTSDEYTFITQEMIEAYDFTISLGPPGIE